MRGSDIDQAALARHVRTALGRLYDPVFLEHHPLAWWLADRSAQANAKAAAGAALRQRLLEAIEALKPGQQADPGARAWRPHTLLHLRYIEAHDPAQVQQELAMSKSQYYREHEQALARLTSLLAEQTVHAADAGGGFADRDRAAPRRTNVPLQLTRFVGRQEEMGQIRRLLATTRLLTLTGAGGSGKTRLALEAATAALPEYEQGVWVVELAPLAEPALVAQTVALTLGVREEAGQPFEATLTRALADQARLLVLDNCEHLVEACARLAETLLRACPGLVVLATSREPLHIAGEAVLQVPTLRAPDPHHVTDLAELERYDAVHLFVDRAAAIQPSFALTEDNATAVAQICHRLDGIPLAIELAAARVSALSVQQISERLEDRFQLLTTGSRTALPRHQTLRAMVDWSYELLSEPEQALLRRLAVFQGGCTLEAAEVVCSGGAMRARMCWMCWVSWSPNRWSSRRNRPSIACGTACWRRSASTARRNWTRRARRAACVKRTPATSSIRPGVAKPTSSVRTSSTACIDSSWNTTTFEPCCPGPAPASFRKAVANR